MKGRSVSCIWEHVCYGCCCACLVCTQSMQLLVTRLEPSWALPTMHLVLLFHLQRSYWLLVWVGVRRDTRAQQKMERGMIPKRDLVTGLLLSGRCQKAKIGGRKVHATNSRQRRPRRLSGSVPRVSAKKNAHQEAEARLLQPAKGQTANNS